MPRSPLLLTSPAPHALLNLCHLQASSSTTSAEAERATSGSPPPQTCMRMPPGTSETWACRSQSSTTAPPWTPLPRSAACHRTSKRVCCFSRTAPSSAPAVAGAPASSRCLTGSEEMASMAASSLTSATGGPPAAPVPGFQLEPLGHRCIRLRGSVPACHLPRKPASCLAWAAWWHSNDTYSAVLSQPDGKACLTRHKRHHYFKQQPLLGKASGLAQSRRS